MDERERNERGQYTETVTPDRVLDAFAGADVPFLATGDIADALSCSNEAARLKLNELYEQGDIERRNVRGAVIVWWLSDDTGVSSSE